MPWRRSRSCYFFCSTPSQLSQHYTNSKQEETTCGGSIRGRNERARGKSWVRELKGDGGRREG